MFTLVTIEETILVPSHLFGKPRLSALEHMVNKRFSDRVIASAGLGIGLWDWVSIGEDRLVTQSGESSTVCVFRLVVFRPFEGEVIFSRINASHDTGIYLELEFFDAVHVERGALPRPTRWDEGEKVWIWRYDVEGGEGIEFYLDVSNECVFRVKECGFENWGRIRPGDRDAEGGKGAMWIEGVLFDEVLEDNQGLGDPLWWDEEGEAEGDGGDEGTGEELEEGGVEEEGENAEGEVGDEWDYVEEGDGDGELIAEGRFESRQEDD